jgi:hypothetical protein
MERTPVTSSNLASVGYDEDSQSLEVEFKGGALYTYTGVPQSEYEGLINADSKGGYFSAHIRNNYPFSKH